MKKQKNTFQIHAKKLFLTYSQTNIKPLRVIEQLQEKFQKQVINQFLIVREKHEDDKNHIHCFIQLEKKAHIKDKSKLDLDDNEGKKTLHGNYQSCKNKEDTLKYLSKEICITNENEDWVADKETINRLKITGKFDGLEETMIELAKQNRIEEAMKLYEKQAPKRFIRDHIHMQKSLTSIYFQNAGLKAVTYKITDFQIPNKLKTLLENWKKNKYNKTVFLIGKPGSGKTEFAKTWLYNQKLNPLTISTRDGLRFLNKNQHKALLFDDFDFKDLDRHELIFLLDNSERSIEIKHSSVSLSSNFPKIATGNINYSKIQYHPLQNDGAVKRRVLFYDLEKDSLIKTSIWNEEGEFFTTYKG